MDTPLHFSKPNESSKDNISPKPVVSELEASPSDENVDGDSAFAGLQENTEHNKDAVLELELEPDPTDEAMESTNDSASILNDQEHSLHPQSELVVAGGQLESSVVPENSDASAVISGEPVQMREEITVEASELPKVTHAGSELDPPLKTESAEGDKIDVGASQDEILITNQPTPEPNRYSAETTILETNEGTGATVVVAESEAEEVPPGETALEQQLPTTEELQLETMPEKSATSSVEDCTAVAEKRQQEAPFMEQEQSETMEEHAEINSMAVLSQSNDCSGATAPTEDFESEVEKPYEEPSMKEDQPMTMETDLESIVEAVVSPRNAEERSNEEASVEQESLAHSETDSDSIGEIEAISLSETESQKQQEKAKDATQPSTTEPSIVAEEKAIAEAGAIAASKVSVCNEDEPNDEEVVEQEIPTLVDKEAKNALDFNEVFQQEGGSKFEEEHLKHIQPPVELLSTSKYDDKIQKENKTTEEEKKEDLKDKHEGTVACMENNEKEKIQERPLPVAKSKLEEEETTSETSPASQAQAHQKGEPSTEQPAASNMIDDGDTGKEKSKALLLLISSMSGIASQKANQDRAMTMLKSLNFPLVTLDGSDPAIKEQRNELFGISGIRGNYPQLFLVNRSGTDEGITFVGDFNTIERMNEDGSLASAVGDTASDDETNTQSAIGVEPASVPTETGPTIRNGKSLVVLISTMSGNLAQKANQERALTMLQAKNIQPELIDGSDQRIKELRNELFEISGVRGNYPQFFLRHLGVGGDSDKAKHSFLGGFYAMESYNDAGQLDDIFDMY